MAKITIHKKDTYGGSLLSLAAVVNIVLLSLSAEYIHWQYYLWALLVAYMWGLALFTRDPGTYINLSSSLTFSLINGIGIILIIVVLAAIVRNPQFLEQLFTTGLQGP